MNIRTQIFRRMASEAMNDVPLSVASGDTCRDVVEEMTARGASSALVLNANDEVLGIVTEQDVTQRIAYKAPPDSPIDLVMTAPVHAIRNDDYLYRAISIMRRLGVRHMPVVTREGRTVGLLDLYEAIAGTSSNLIEQIDRLTVESTPRELRRVKRFQMELVDELFAEGVPATEIQQLLTDINKDLYRRVVRWAISEMEQEGWGTPPVEFDVLIMGSGGRGEHFLHPDQDNGFIIDDYPDDEHTRIDGYFIELADRMTKTLGAIGFPLCRGNVMAINPLWRKTISQWKAQTSGWSRKRNFIAARLVGIFYDFRWTYGRRDLTRGLREHVTEGLGKSRGFQMELYQDEVDHGTALGWFSRFIVEKEESEHKGGINLKFNGLLPLVEAIRLMAMRHGIPETATLSRINRLREGDVLDRDENEYLQGAFRHITTLLLRQQVADYLAGRKVSNFVKPDDLSKRDRERLIESFRAIDNLRERLRAEFTASVF